MAEANRNSTYVDEQVPYFTHYRHLISFLGHKDGWVRHQARECLVILGKPAVPDLMEALTDKNEDVRWEAAKALGQIKDPMAAPALAKALSDKNFGVRWLAAKGLIIMRGAAIFPLLLELINHPDSIWLRQGASHILHDLARKKGYAHIVAPVIAALEGYQPALNVPIAAKNIIDKMVTESV